MRDEVKALVNAPASQNPIIELYHKLKGEEGRSLTAEELMLMEAEIRKTMETGHLEKGQVSSAIGRLSQAPPMPATQVPRGF